MTMFGDIKDSIAPVLEEFFTDEELIREITYKKYTGESFDPVLKYTVATYDSKPIPAIRMLHTARTASVTPGAVQAGQVLYMLRTTDAPEGMSLKDMIVDGETIVAVSVINDIFGIVFEVTVEASNVTK